MKNIMVLLFSFAKIEKVIEEVSNSINDQTSNIFLCFYQKKDVPDTLSSLMGVYLGDKIKKDVENTILKEYFRMKDEITQRFIILTSDKDIAIHEQLFKDYSIRKISSYIKEQNIDYLIVNYFKNEYNSQKVFVDIKKEFLNKLDIKYKLFKQHK